ncbi:MAG: HAD hydrolase family protein [Solirubrobacterales bacterium]
MSMIGFAASPGTAVLHVASNVYWPGWTEITIQHRAAEKGAAVPDLLDACALSNVDVIACGDHLNDLGLFVAATHSIVPAKRSPNRAGECHGDRRVI